MVHHSDGPSLTIQVTGLVHDLGKLLHFFGSEGQWDVVGVSDCLYLFLDSCFLLPLLLCFALFPPFGPTIHLVIPRLTS